MSCSCLNAVVVQAERRKPQHFTNPTKGQKEWKSLYWVFEESPVSNLPFLPYTHIEIVPVMRSSSNHHHESPTVQYLTAMYRSGSLLSPSGGSRMNLNLVTYKKYSDSVQAKSVLWSLCSSAPLSNKCQNPGTRVDLTPSYNQYNNSYKFLCLCVYSRFLCSILMKYVHTQAPVRLCTLIHPGVEDSTNGSPKLRFGILWELFTKL